MFGGAFKELLTGAVGGPVGGLLGESAGKFAQASFEALFGGTWDEVKLHARGYLDRPLNHDLERSLRFAALVGCLVVVHEQALQEDADRIGARDHRPDPFTPAARRWLHGQFAALEKVPEGAHAEAIALLEATLDTALVAARDGRDAAEATERRREAEAAMWRELMASPAAAQLPQDFEARFLSADPGRPDWFTCFVAFLREALKEKPDARVALLVGRIAALRNGLRRVEEALAAVRATGDRTERKVEAVGAEQAAQRALLEGLVARIEEGDGLRGGAAGIHPRARAARLGNHAEQPRHRAGQARGARRRCGAASGGGGLRGGAGGTHPRARAARLGDDAEQPRQRVLQAREAGRRCHASPGGRSL
jgi:hypothetical protein